MEQLVQEIMEIVWFVLMLFVPGWYPAIVFFVRQIFIYRMPQSLCLFVYSLAVAVILGFYITIPLFLEVFELCLIASSLSSISAIWPLLSVSSVVSVVTLLIQAYSFAVVNLGLCYETIGLIMPEKAWRLYTDFEFHYATKPVCFMKRCFYSKPEDVDVELGVWQL